MVSASGGKARETGGDFHGGLISPDLLTIGRESFVADSASLGTPNVDGGRIHRAGGSGKAHFCREQRAMSPSRSRLADNLIGCLSVPPAAETLEQYPHAAWLGSRWLRLPRDRKVELSHAGIFRPRWYMYLLRGGIDFSG